MPAKNATAEPVAYHVEAILRVQDLPLTLAPMCVAVCRTRAQADRVVDGLTSTGRLAWRCVRVWEIT